MHCSQQVRWSARQGVPVGGHTARLLRHPGPLQTIACRVLQTACIERMPNSQQSSLQQHARSSFIVRASRKQNSSAEDPNKVWRLKDLLTSNDGDDQSSCSASNDHQQQAINSHSASNKFPAQQWSGEQQAKQQYRQQQWELWNQRQQQLERRERIKAWQEAQQQQQQQMDAAAGPQGEQHMPYAYDQTRWKVRNQQWRSGAPPRLDYLVVSPHNAAEKHARYMAGKLLFRSSGRIMLLFHNYKGATKTLAILATAGKIMQRKHSCSLLCQVGLTVHDPLRMRLLAKLWPYAGVLHPTPDAAALARSSSSSSSSDDTSNDSVVDTTTAAGEAETASSADGSSGSSGGKGLMHQCLQGLVPKPQNLPATIRHLPPVAIPVVISQHHSFTSSRTTDARRLAKSIATSLAMKGRCRVQTAGGIAALHALTAVALAEYLLRKAQGKSLAMHVGAKKRVEQQVPGSTEWPHVVMYYEITLLVANADWDGTPATCVFRPVAGRSRGNNQQQQQQQGAGLQQQQEQQHDESDASVS